ncbi:MAG: hypothetical protein K2I93_07650 [Oscillospiraceae bacterium]|nr:hypothetical protein [Oscillospiraceae bacterium]
MNQRDNDRILLAHVQDLVRKNAYRSFTAFLDMRQYSLVKAGLTAGTYRFYGGHPEAERGILCIHPTDLPPEDDEFPITCLTFTFPEVYILTHRDVLGSLMAQQVQRDTVGDILVSPGKIQCFVTGAAAAVGTSLTKIGRVGVKVTDTEPFANDFVQEVRVITGTVATPRLDAVMRTALNVGRQVCHQYILGGAVMVNYEEVTKPDKLLVEGDVFSVRGFGKLRVKELSGPTRKNRLHIVVEKFL